MLYRATLFLLLVAVILTAAPASAQEPNVTYYYHPSWQYPVLPTASIPATFPISVPAVLPGNSTSVYWNLVGWNNGAVSTLVPVPGTIEIDGQYLSGWVMGGPISAGASYSIWDIGPINVRGGRHTFEAVHDKYDEIAESDENDNRWAHQFVFTPYVLSESTPKTRGTPPDEMGGIFSVIDGSLTDFNCDGFRFSSSGWWNAVTLYSRNASHDYDMELFNPSTGSENGFIGSSTGSYFIQGYLDALIVNRNTVGITDYDVSVYKDSGDSEFVIEQVISQPAGVGSIMAVSLGTDEYLRIWDTWIGDLGWVTVAVTDSLARGDEVFVGWVEHDVTETSITGMSGLEIMDPAGETRLHRDFTTIGYYGLVVFRVPKDGGGPMDLTVVIEPTPPDLQPAQISSWHSPLVPTPVPITTGLTPTLPDTLYGYMPQTYLNFGMANFSDASSPSVDSSVYQDGMDNTFTGYTTGGLLPYEVVGVTDLSAVEFPGGRHTLTVKVDHTESIHEIYETNNIYGEQYCWSPLELSLGWEYSHYSPGPFSGGLETILSGDPIFYNCDGYRMYTGYANWEGLVLTQGPTSDYDLTVHHTFSGTKDGFGEVLATSIMYQNETDYVLFNNNVLPTGVHDIGVENIGGDTPYTIEAVGSTSLPVPVTGHHGPYTMPISDMLHLFNIYLEQDVYAFRLDNLAGAVDWGIALHQPDILYQGRQDAMLGGTAYLAGPGDPEWFTVDVPAAGYYGLAVFKAAPSGFDISGDYKLTILQGVSDVPDEEDLPVATALAGIHPNPFNPQTTISYELAAAAVVELEIYDVKGARVRRLVSESMPAGRHDAVWNGEDDSGARVASGVYLARFNAGQYRDVRKLVMVK